MRARFELENAHTEMKLLTMQDHLTGAWNRRYLDMNFQEFARRCHQQNKPFHVAVLDIESARNRHALCSNSACTLGAS